MHVSTTTHRPHDGRARTTVLAAVLVVLGIALLSAAAAAHESIDLGPSVALDAELHVPAADPSIAWAAMTASARGQADEVVTTFVLHEDGEQVRLQGVLPDLVGSALPVPVTEPEMWPCPVRVDADARFLPVRFVIDGVGSIDIGLQPPTSTPLPGMVQLIFVYADADVGVEGACRDDTLGMAVTIDVVFRPGWNLVASEFVEAGDEQAMALRSATGTERQAARWFVTSLGQQVRPDAPPAVRDAPLPARPGN